MERSFHANGRMKAMTSKADKARTKGHLPFFSCDTWEEADAVLEEAIRQGEIARTPDGRLIEVRLAETQTIDILMDAGAALAAIHAELFPKEPT